MINNGNITIYGLNEENYTVSSGYYSTLCDYTQLDGDEVYYVTQDSDALEQLLQVAQAQYYSEIPCMKMEINGEFYVIPEESVALAQQVIQEDCSQRTVIN